MRQLADLAVRDPFKAAVIQMLWLIVHVLANSREGMRADVRKALDNGIQKMIDAADAQTPKSAKNGKG